MGVQVTHAFATAKVHVEAGLSAAGEDPLVHAVVTNLTSVGQAFPISLLLSLDFL